MPVLVSLDQVLQLAPNARHVYRSAFEQFGAAQLEKAGISDNPLRVAYFMAMALHETGGLTITTESLYYTHAWRLMRVWPSRFTTPLSAAPFLRNPEKLANQVYGGRMGNVEPGDGFRFIGRGLLQITGRESYTRVATATGLPELLTDPALAYSAEHAIEIAGTEWGELGCNARADSDSIESVTQAINGGLIGLAERKQWLAKTKRIWG